VLLALRSRDRTGKGQVVDIGLYESIFRILDELAPAYQQGGFVRRRMGAGTVNAVPHSHYPTKDDRWVAIACTNDKIFERLARLMGRPELAGDGLYGTIARREAARADVDAMVGGWTATMDRAELLGQCADAQVPCGPVYAVDEIFDDPQYAARENIARVDSRVGEIALPNVMPRLTETPGAIDWTGRPLAADNQAVFRDLLGLSDEDIDALREKGVI
jgi:crotonobetainyl-CoA:carnitine CoA-transferase CaiB-like acyl-CoA transferase